MSTAKTSGSNLLTEYLPDDADTETITAIEKYRSPKDGQPMLQIQPTIFVPISDDEQKTVDEKLKNAAANEKKLAGP